MSTKLTTKQQTIVNHLKANYEDKQITSDKIAKELVLDLRSVKGIVSSLVEKNAITITNNIISLKTTKKSSIENEIIKEILSTGQETIHINWNDERKSNRKLQDFARAYITNEELNNSTIKVEPRIENNRTTHGYGLVLTFQTEPKVSTMYVRFHPNGKFSLDLPNFDLPLATLQEGIKMLISGVKHKQHTRVGRHIQTMCEIYNVEYIETTEVTQEKPVESEKSDYEKVTSIERLEELKETIENQEQD